MQQDSAIEKQNFDDRDKDGDVDFDVDLNLDIDVEDEGEKEDEEFYTPGPEALYDTRLQITANSLTQAKQRLQQQYEALQGFDKTAYLQLRRAMYAKIDMELSLQGTQLVSNRFTSAISYSLGQIAVGAWDGSCYILDSQDLSVRKTYQNLHPEKLSGLDHSSNGETIATGGSDGIINIIQGNTNTDVDSDAYATHKLTGHLARINCVKFHQLNAYLASASADLTWRLWDVPKQQELYYQEGHSDAVNVLSHHPDGSLLASAGNDAILKLWDLRSGNLILDLHENGHIKPIHALDWRSNGYQIASGGADAQLIIWDVRMGKKLTTVPAHNKLVSTLKFTTDDHETLVSGGYDGTVSLSSCDNWTVYKKFNTLDKIMALDTFETNDRLNILTGGWDRSIKLYN